ncbi:MAG: response regulator transcription factor [Verrucomicrobiota bacterium]|jgi:DNA-binding response OmpR family regulator|nr:response regulator transcription factor [Verrucomicrobiota bacterium]
MATKKILVVDDDKDLALGLVVRLKANDYNVVVASDAEAAVSVALKEKPDLVILDIGLPDDDGFAVMLRLQNMVSTIGTPIIMLTGRDPAKYKEHALWVGAEAFFQKPVENEELLAAIRQALGESPTASP